jgi:hypothetical protein
MKRLLLTGIFITVTLFAVSAQGAYFEIGGGPGWATTSIDGRDVRQNFGLGLEFGIKVGYGPILGLPIYAVGVAGGLAHLAFDFDERGEDSSFEMTFIGTTLFGPGLIFYPIRNLQLAASIGYSYVTINWAEASAWGEHSGSESGNGVAWDLSAAIDLGTRNHGLLIGLRYFGSATTVAGSDVNQWFIGCFARYSFKHK